jgi:hypothetical protein
MAKCAFCGSTILMGGVQAGGLRFCNKKCHRNAAILSGAKQVPADLVDKKLQEIWNGVCPKCLGAGPVDVHRTHEVWSALVLTRWSTHQQISCRSCATKRQLSGSAFSLFAGWWGFPWGLVMTPVQITRNIMAMSSGPDKSRPSEDLRKLVLVELGAQYLAAVRQKAPATPVTGSTATPPPLPPPPG